MCMKKVIVLPQMPPAQAVTSTLMESHMECQEVDRITREICRTSNLMPMEMQFIQQESVAWPLMLAKMALLENLL